MPIEYLIFIAILILLFLFVLNYVIHLHFAKSHRKINEQLEDHSFEKFSNIKTRMNSKGIIGLPFGTFRSEVIFINKNIFVLLSNKPLPFAKINQSVIHFTKAKKGRSFEGISKIYRIKTIHHKDKIITIEFGKEDLIGSFKKIQLDLKHDDTDIKDVLKKMKLN